MLARFRVEDKSMLPSFKPGDYVLVRGFRKLKPGDVVVFERQGRAWIKRVARVEGEKIFVAGDNAAKSIDSRTFGPISKTDIKGNVFVHAKGP